MIYQNLTKNNDAIVPRRKIIYHFADGPYLEILGNVSSKYLVKFVNDDTDEVVYKTTIANNHWAKASIKYFINWRIEVYEGSHLIFYHVYNAENKKVFVSLDSSALGDTIAWMPFVDKFQKKHNCQMVVSTFRNALFKEAYPNITFVEPGEGVNDIYARYNIGCFNDRHKEPVLPNTIPLQKVASNILGLEYEEIKPKIVKKVGSHIYHKKYVTISTSSTAGCKTWSRDEWQKLINHLYGKGYNVVNVSKEEEAFDNCYVIVNSSIENTISVICNSEFFIGLSSGLSWLAWALDKPVVMIANFTEEYYEFDCIRVTNKNVCHGCWNNPNFKFDRGDWNWCPINKNTPKNFECHRSISHKDVINKLVMLSPTLR